MSSHAPHGQEIVVYPRDSAATPATMFYLEPMRPDWAENGQPHQIVQYWLLLRRRMGFLLAVVIAGCAVGALFSFQQMPMFQARVALEIQGPSEGSINVRIGDLQSDRPTMSPESYLPTQAKILQTGMLQERVYKKLNTDSPELARAPARAPIWRRVLGVGSGDGSGKPAIPPVSTRVRLAEGTRVIEVLCDSSDPKVAAAYANALASEYIDMDFEARWDSINRAREWLNLQLDDIRAKLEKSEAQLQSYGQSSQLLFTSDRENVENEKLLEIQAELSKAQAERIRVESLYKTAIESGADSVPEVVDNTRLNTYQMQLATLRREMAELMTQFTTEHYKVRRLQVQIDELDRTFSTERENVIKRVGNEYRAALMRERLLAEAYREHARVAAQQAERAITYGILKREVDTNRQLYDSLLQKTKEAGIATATRASNIRIVDRAEPPASPYKPNLIFNTMLAMFTALGFGVVVVVTRENLDSSFRSPGEASTQLRIPELGVIPIAQFGSYKRSASLDAGGQLLTIRNENPFITEAFRSVVTSVMCAGHRMAFPRVILVSSAVRGEGKSTVVTNLAIALAEIEQRVLLIDADLRRPRLHTILGVSNAWGLSDLLREKTAIRDCSLETLVQRTEVPGLAFLSSGPGATNITSLLYSKRMSELVQRFRSEFDAILIDTPPMLDISDARILGRLVDAVILVVRAGKTDRAAAAAAKHRLSEDGLPVLGSVLNAWDLRSSRYPTYTAYH